MVAGQSCIAGPSVIVTSFYSRLVCALLLLSPERATKKAPIAGQCLRVPGRHERTYAVCKDSRSCALSTPILRSNNQSILWYLSLLLSASLFVFSGMEGRFCWGKLTPVLAMLGHLEWRGKRRRDGPCERVKRYI
jgi:hypothetical protein